MYKLLTEEGKNKVESEYKQRRSVVILTFCALIGTVILIGLFPTYLNLNLRENEANAQMEALNNSFANNSIDNLDTWLSDINTKIKLFSPAADSDKPYEAFANILKLMPSGISISGISYSKSGNKAEYSLEGTASDRRSLVNFQDAINASDQFADANIPVSDLAKDKNIDFHLTLSPKK